MKIINMNASNKSTKKGAAKIDKIESRNTVLQE